MTHPQPARHTHRLGPTAAIGHPPAAVELLRRGASRARFWLVVVGVWIPNYCLEVTMLNTRIYYYVGDQPLPIGQFPAVWLVLAMLVPSICQAVTLGEGHRLAGCARGGQAR